jgi:hypothetical protein
MPAFFAFFCSNLPAKALAQAGIIKFCLQKRNLNMLLITNVPK